MKCESLIPACFPSRDAPFGGEASEAAHRYGECCRAAGLSWADAGAQIKRFLEAQGFSPIEVGGRLDTAKGWLRPYFERP